MHICYITGEYPTQCKTHGGVGTFVQTIARKLVAQGHRVTVIGLGEKALKTIDLGVEVYQVERSRMFKLGALLSAFRLNKKLRRLHKETPIDVIESAELGLSFLKKISRVLYVIRLHGGHHFFAEAENRGINKWKAVQEQRSFKKADAFIAVSEYVKNHTEKYLSYHNAPVAQINNMIDCSVFEPNEDGVKNKTLVFVGTICEKKGVRQLIMAFSKVYAFDPEIELALYGRDWFYPDGSSYIEELKSTVLASDEAWVKAVVFKGSVLNTLIPSIYNQARICVFPSHMETLGLVAPEAMLMEKPVIFTNKGPGPEVIKDGITGLLCNPHSPEDIAEKVVWMLQHPVEAQQMGKNARKDILQRFDVEVILKQNIDFYQSIANGFSN
jgi:glycosyltransferase involved in cell wall biosynthesis